MKKCALAGAASLCLLLLAAAPAAHGAGLPTTPAEAEAIEGKQRLPLTAFYDAPALDAAGKPGELLRREIFTGYDLPPGTQAMRILYRSRDADGQDVVSSGVVLTPAGTAPRGGWPVIVWAHGTSGVARQCAPSAMKDLYYNAELTGMVQAGYAVVAVDYHGLGTAGPHQYMASRAQAEDVVDAVPAARKAVPALGEKWVVDGHSQGGQAAWAVAELEAQRQDPGYLGAVSVAGATHLAWAAAHQTGLDGAGFYLAWWTYAIKARYSAFDPAGILADGGAAHYEAATTAGCWYAGYALYSDTPARDMLKPRWQDNAYVKRFLADSLVGSKTPRGPMLAIAGEADASVPLDGIKDTVARACAHGATLSFKTYPGLDHDPAMSDSLPDQLAWIGDRFAGKPAPNSCR